MKTILLLIALSFYANAYSMTTYNPDGSTSTTFVDEGSMTTYTDDGIYTTFFND